MTSEFVAMLNNLKIAPYMANEEAKSDKKEEFKKLYLLSEERRKYGIIPRYYKNPCGCQLELTYRCNQYCLTCYNHSGGERNKWESLSVEEWKGVARQLAELGVFQCVISGGEPLIMGDSLFEIMDILHDAGVKFLLITNGTLLTPEKVEKLTKYEYDNFQISIDSSRPEINNYIRGAETWEKAVHGASMVYEAGLPLVITHVVVKQNLALIEEMVDMAYYLGAKQVVLGPVEISGRAIGNYASIGITEQEEQDLCARARKKRIQYENRMDVQVVLSEIMTFQYRITEANSVILIRPNGDVKFDSILPYVIGNVKRQKIKEIWDTLGYNIYEHPVLRAAFEKLESREDLNNYLMDINATTDRPDIYLTKTK